MIYVVIDEVDLFSGVFYGFSLWHRWLAKCWKINNF